MMERDSRMTGNVNFQMVTVVYVGRAKSTPTVFQKQCLGIGTSINKRPLMVY
jgi:hypothetical protein